MRPNHELIRGVRVYIAFSGPRQGPGRNRRTAARENRERVSVISKGISAMVASKGLRLAAFLIDGVLLGISLAVLVAAVFAMAAGADSDEAQVAFVVIGGLSGLALLFAYKFILELTPWRATFGKRILGIRVVAADGTEAGAGAIIGRELLYVVFSSISVVNLIFYIMLAVDEDARGWHDHLASTKVVKGRGPAAPAA